MLGALLRLSRPVGLSLLVGGLVLVGLLSLPAPAEAATITVTGTGVAQANDGVCTLVEALNNANANVQQHPDCAAGQGGVVIDTVAFQIPTFSDPGCNLTTRVCTIFTNLTYTIIDPVTIDGYTQTNTSPNTLAVGTNAVIRIKLQPANTSVNTGLRIAASNVTIRGLSIGGYSESGIAVENGANSQILGCFLGIDPNGTQALGSPRKGILVTGANGTLIGGETPADRNLISGNNEAGILIDGAQATAIMGNAIGTNAAGTAGVPNLLGVYLRAGFTQIGGTRPELANVIAYNSLRGVEVNTGSGIAILGNAIYRNGQLGIDLRADSPTEGPTPNDVRDEDIGPNGFQNFPDLTNAGVGSANTTVYGSLSSAPNSTYRIEIFANDACDPSGYGEGQRFVRALDVTTDGVGDGSFVTTFPPVAVGMFLTATATSFANSSTSEFSRCLPVVQAVIASPNRLTTTSFESLQDAAFHAGFSVALTSRPTANVTIPVSITDPTEGRIVSGSTLVFTPLTGMLPQLVKIKGVDDAIDDGDITYTVVLGPATSADPNYNGQDPQDVTVINIDDDTLSVQCGPRPKVGVTTTKIGPNQLRATVAIRANPNAQNELRSITWDQFAGATVTLDGGGAVQAGQSTAFPSLTQSASFVVTRTPGASSGTVRLTLTDACGSWPTFVGGGPNAW